MGFGSDFLQALKDGATETVEAVSGAVVQQGTELIENVAGVVLGPGEREPSPEREAHLEAGAGGNVVAPQGVTATSGAAAATQATRSAAGGGGVPWGWLGIGAALVGLWWWWKG